MLSLVKPRRATLPAYPPVFTSVGGDLCQFVAVQAISNFGLHGYYAISTEPLCKWSHASTNTAKKATAMPKHYADCFKDRCMLAESIYCPKKSGESGFSSSPPPQSTASQQQPETPAQSSQAPASSRNTGSSRKTRQQKLCESISKPTTQFLPLPSIPFQTCRKEIAGFESRPSWGRSRYMERLIDESPHLAADLDVSQANAMLNVMNDKTFKKAEDYGPCAISNNRRRTERMLDLPPCAIAPEEIKPNLGSSYICCPKREEMIDIHTDICLSEHDFYSCGKRSGVSLRGGSDSGGCCSSQNQRSRSRTSNDTGHNDVNPHQYYTPELSRPLQRNQDTRNGSIFHDTDDPMDVDTSIHNTTTASKYINPNTSGNFKWLEDIENIALSNSTQMSFEECNSRARMRPFSSDTMTNESDYLATAECSELNEELPINDQLHPEKLMPQIARQMQSSQLDHSRGSPSLSQRPPSCNLYNESHAQDDWGRRQIGMRHDNNGTEPSMAVLRRRFAKSREVTKRNPEMYEKSYKWKEIIDKTER